MVLHLHITDNIAKNKYENVSAGEKKNLLFTKVSSGGVSMKGGQEVIVKLEGEKAEVCVMYTGNACMHVWKWIYPYHGTLGTEP